MRASSWDYLMYAATGIRNASPGFLKCQGSVILNFLSYSNAIVIHSHAYSHWPCNVGCRWFVICVCLLPFPWSFQKTITIRLCDLIWICVSINNTLGKFFFFFSLLSLLPHFPQLIFWCVAISSTGYESLTRSYGLMTVDYWVIDFAFCYRLKIISLIQRIRSISFEPKTLSFFMISVCVLESRPWWLVFTKGLNLVLGAEG